MLQNMYYYAVDDLALEERYIVLIISSTKQDAEDLIFTKVSCKCANEVKGLSWTQFLDLYQELVPPNILKALEEEKFDKFLWFSEIQLSKGIW